MKIISAQTREEAWLEAVNHLQYQSKDGIEYNLILEIIKPAAKGNKRSIEIRQKCDKFLKDSNAYSIQTVADTIFPSILYKKYNFNGMIEKYEKEEFSLIKRCQGNNRGTYALRIIQGFNSKGEKCSPLQNIVSRLKKNVQRSGVRCAYEISLDDCESIPINRNDTNLYGFPCLSHLSFKLSHDRSELHLTAIYRSQYFVKKALGNLLGLARLQHAICREIGVEVGTLVCHATYASLDNTGNKTKFKKLIESFKEE